MKSGVLAVVADDVRAHLGVQPDGLVLEQLEVALRLQKFGRFHCCVHCPMLEEDAKRRSQTKQESYSAASHVVYWLV